MSTSSLGRLEAMNIKKATLLVFRIRYNSQNKKLNHHKNPQTHPFEQFLDMELKPFLGLLAYASGLAVAATIPQENAFDSMFFHLQNHNSTNHIYIRES